jgi:hypothetical protein
VCTLFGAISIARADNPPNEHVKLVCDLDVETSWLNGDRVERAKDRVSVDVERTARALYVEVMGKELAFAISTHSTTVTDYSDAGRWQLVHHSLPGQRSEERQITIDRNSGRLTYFLSDPVRQVNAAGDCARVDTAKRLF